MRKGNKEIYYRPGPEGQKGSASVGLQLRAQSPGRAAGSTCPAVRTSRTCQVVPGVQQTQGLVSVRLSLHSWRCYAPTPSLDVRGPGSRSLYLLLEGSGWAGPRGQWGSSSALVPLQQVEASLGRARPSSQEQLGAPAYVNSSPGSVNH